MLIDDFPQCFPLFSLLLAVGNPKVNLLVLDIEVIIIIIIFILRLVKPFHNHHLQKYYSDRNQYQRHHHQPPFLLRAQCLSSEEEFVYTVIAVFMVIFFKGAEFEVLKQVPWEKVDVEVLMVELAHAGKVPVNAHDCH